MTGTVYEDIRAITNGTGSVAITNAGTVISAGGREIVSFGGLATATIVSAGGTEAILSGGIASGTLIEAAPVIVLPASDCAALDSTIIYDYYFHWDGDPDGVGRGARLEVTLLTGIFRVRHSVTHGQILLRRLKLPLSVQHATGNQAHALLIRDGFPGHGHHDSGSPNRG